MSDKQFGLLVVLLVVMFLTSGCRYGYLNHEVQPSHGQPDCSQGVCLELR